MDPVELNEPWGLAVSTALGIAVAVAVALWEVTPREAGADTLGVAPAQPATANSMTDAIAAHLRRRRELANIDTRAALLLINARPQGRRLRGACDGRDGRQARLRGRVRTRSVKRSVMVCTAPPTPRWCPSCHSLR